MTMAMAAAIRNICPYISCMRMGKGKSKGNGKGKSVKIQKPKLEGRCSREAENNDVNDRVSRTLVMERYNNETTK
ncbi:hypothetical protein KI387_009591, partial [Taxus chinensis]